MKTTYLGLATLAMALLTLTTFARAEPLGTWSEALEAPIAIEDARPLGTLGDDPLGLLWDEEGLPYDEEIRIENGLILT